jgi:hypothetical protein
MSQLTTIDTNNYAAMAKAMGIANEKPTGAASSSLARLRIHHTPLMGPAEVNGKKVNVEVVEGGSYKLEIPDGPTYYASEIKIRPFLQRFMYKRFVQATGKSPNRYVKSVMTDDAKLQSDLKDNDGGFNCGKPAGYIKDFKALPEKMQELLKSIKRVRVILGTVEMINPTDDKGNPVDVDETPVVWEIDNRDAFTELGKSFATMTKMSLLPIQHVINLKSDERKIPTGASYYVPIASLDVTKVLEVEKEQHDMFADFLSWVDNYNTYILNSWSEKANAKMQDEDVDVVDDIVDIDIDDEDAA